MFYPTNPLDFEKKLEIICFLDYLKIRYLMTMLAEKYD